MASVKYAEENSLISNYSISIRLRSRYVQLAGWMLADLDPLFEFEWEVGWGGGGRFLNFFVFRMAGCSSWALIRG